MPGLWQAHAGRAEATNKRFKRDANEGATCEGNYKQANKLLLKIVTPGQIRSVSSNDLVAAHCISLWRMQITSVGYGSFRSLPTTANWGSGRP